LKIFCILLPSPFPTGPIKGAYALANSLAQSSNLDVFIIFLRNGPGVNAFLDKRVKLIILAKHKNLISKLFAYKTFLKQLGNKNNIISLSMCFSADLVNSFCGNKANTISSIRANNYENYKFTYGIIGIFIAHLHFKLLPRFKHVVSMNKSMQNQIKKRCNIDSKVIPNFIDELDLDKYRNKKKIFSKNIKFIFLGSLSERKRPDLLIDTIANFKNENVSLEIVGDGPLYPKLKKIIEQKKLKNKVHLHGFLENPYKILANSDILILPSFSEGTSRAVLEALHLGLICIISDVDGNRELFKLSSKIVLINKNLDIMSSMKKAINLASKCKSRESNLPLKHRQKNATKEFIKLK